MYTLHSLVLIAQQSVQATAEKVGMILGIVVGMLIGAAAIYFVRKKSE